MTTSCLHVGLKCAASHTHAELKAELQEIPYLGLSNADLPSNQPAYQMKAACLIRVPYHEPLLRCRTKGIPSLVSINDGQVKRWLPSMKGGANDGIGRR